MALGRMRPWQSILRRLWNESMFLLTLEAVGREGKMTNFRWRTGNRAVVGGGGGEARVAVGVEWGGGGGNGGGGGGGGGRGGGGGGGGGWGGRGNAAAARGGAGGGRIQEFVPSTLGIALVTGYDQMNFPPEVPPLTKPYLRKEMELKMKGICEGRLRKEDVVRESLDMYRGVFAVASREVGRLRESCNRFLGGGGGPGG